MGELLKNKIFKIAVLIIGIAFGIGYAIGFISTYGDKDEVKEKSAYEILQEGMERYNNELKNSVEE